ncbi:MAG: hypothetical protein P4M11_16095 [Candidatus Pacebacteria bacterium]|nr:hypothetical protein [Candidatus Paceibacterota bacterium]
MICSFSVCFAYAIPRIDQLASQSKLKDKTGAIVTVADPCYQDWRKSDMYNEIIADIVMLNNLLAEIHELDDPDYGSHGWQKCTHTEKKKTWCRPVPGSSAVEVACDCIINTHIFKPLSLFAEVDLYAKWIPRLSYCGVEKSFSRFRKTVQCVANFPWPFNDREGICHGYGTALPDQNAVIVVLRSISNNSATKEYMGCKFPEPRSKKNVKLIVNYGCMYFRFIDENTTLFRGIFNSDPNMRLVPQFLINFAIKKVVYAMLGIIQDRCGKFEGTEFEKRVKENTYLYDEIRRRLNFTIKK